MMLPEPEKDVHKIIRESMGEDVDMSRNQFWSIVILVMLLTNNAVELGAGVYYLLSAGFAGLGISLLFNIIEEVVSE